MSLAWFSICYSIHNLNYGTFKMSTCRYLPFRRRSVAVREEEKFANQTKTDYFAADILSAPHNDLKEADRPPTIDKITSNGILYSLIWRAPSCKGQPSNLCRTCWRWCNAMQWNEMKWNAMQCNAMQCNAMQCNAMQCNAMQCDAMQCNAM